MTGNRKRYLRAKQAVIKKRQRAGEVRKEAKTEIDFTEKKNGLHSRGQYQIVGEKEKKGMNTGVGENPQTNWITRRVKSLSKIRLRVAKNSMI